jgi:hypothetical protein
MIPRTADATFGRALSLDASVRIEACELARRQTRGLAHRGVVHVQIGADGAHHDSAGAKPDPR